MRTNDEDDNSLVAALLLLVQLSLSLEKAAERCGVKVHEAVPRRLSRDR
jgi:hypothetical protein